MNKIIIALFLVSLAMAGCQKKIVDNIGGKTVDQRLSAALTAYQQKLTSAPFGWIVVETTTGTALNAGAPLTGPIAAFSYYMQFDTSNRVTMYSDWDTVTARTPRSSSYRIQAVQRPSLIFDTYSYIHLPCDPDPNISKSPFGAGFGWGTDFEFSFADSAAATSLGDTIHLLGNLNSAPAIMFKATQAQQTAYLNGTFANDIVLGKIQNYFRDVNVGGTTIQFTPGLNSRVIDIDWLNGPNNLKSISTPFYQIADGIEFTRPPTIGGKTVAGLDNIVWNNSTITGTLKVNGVSGTLAGAVAPIFYDTNTVVNWYLAAYDVRTVYFSPNGFHINGVDNAFRLDTLTAIVDTTNQLLPFNAYIYFPNAFGSFIDAFSPFFANAADAGYPSYIGAAFPTNFSPTTTFLVFPQDVTPPAVTATNNIMTDPNGFYFILKEDGTSYDMVLATDAKTWLTWTFLHN
jgi:hypothetical protein